MSMESSTTNKSGTSNGLRVSSSPTVSYMNLVAPTPSPPPTHGLNHPQPQTIQKETNCIHSALTTPTNVQTPTTPATADLTLYPPSQTIGESLTSLASRTAAQLEQVWDVVGYTPEERAGQISDLLSEMRQLCEAKVAEEKGVEEQFRRAIADAKEEMLVTTKALKSEIDPTLLEDQGHQSLQDELATLEATLDNLRHEASEASNDLTECRDRLITMHQALGTELASTWTDVKSDLSEDRLDAFRKHVAEMEEAVASRTSTVVQLIYDCSLLMKELRIDVEEQLSDFDRKILASLIEDEGTKKITMRSTRENENCTGISSKTMEDLTKRVSDLNKEKRRRKMKLGEMGGEIARLWEMLRVPEDLQRAFTQSVQGLGMETIQKGQDELERLRVLKTEMIGKLIGEARQTIHQLWDETNAGEQQRQFEAMEITDETRLTDGLLQEHQDYILTLQERLNMMRPMIKIIEKREEILKERYDYEQLQKDPDRLQQRGAALTKQLMKEEKMSRRIKKDLPKYTDMLVKRLHEWQGSNGEPFLFRGESYLDTIRKQDEDWQAYKDNEAQMKLKKKQEEIASENTINGTNYMPLPGRKKNIAVSQPGRSRPLTNAQNRENSRSRTLSRSRAKSQSRAKSRTRGTSVSSRHTAVTN